MCQSCTFGISYIVSGLVFPSYHFKSTRESWFRFMFMSIDLTLKKKENPKVLFTTLSHTLHSLLRISNTKVCTGSMYVYVIGIVSIGMTKVGQRYV